MKNICWIIGSFHQRKQIIDSLKEQIPHATNHTFDKGDSAEKISDFIKDGQGGLFGGGGARIILLKDIPNFKKQSTSAKQWCQTFDQISDNDFVIIDNVPKSKTTIFKHVGKIGRTVANPENLQRDEAVALVQKVAHDNKKKISDSTVNLILEMVGQSQDKGYSYDLIWMNLEKILMYLEKEKTIEDEHVVKCVYNTSELVIWKLFNHFDKRNYCAAKKLLSRTIGQHDASELCEMILNMSKWRYELILYIKEQQANLGNAVKAAESTADLIKHKGEGAAGERTYSVDLNKDGSVKKTYSENMAMSVTKSMYGNSAPVDIYSRVELIMILNTIYYAIPRVRELQTEQERLFVLENFFLTICKVFSNPDLVKMRI